MFTTILDNEELSNLINDFDSTFIDDKFPVVIAMNLNEDKMTDHETDEFNDFLMWIYDEIGDDNFIYYSNISLELQSMGLEDDWLCLGLKNKEAAVAIKLRY